MSIDPRVHIGHVHLKVADIDRAVDFYRDILGFDVMQRYGSEAAFLSAGGYHHHLGLNTWESRGGSPPPPGTTGLYHVAIRYPDRRTLGDALRRLAGDAQLRQRLGEGARRRAAALFSRDRMVRVFRDVVDAVVRSPERLDERLAQVAAP